MRIIKLEGFLITGKISQKRARTSCANESSQNRYREAVLALVMRKCTMFGSELRIFSKEKGDEAARVGSANVPTE